MELREKISDVCSLISPKVWPIVWQLMYGEPLIEVVSDEDPVEKSRAVTA
jgi:hypothetical protein